MPSLKLGLGLDRQSSYKNVYRELLRENAKLILSAPKASGTAPLTGVQSPWVDLSKNGNNAVGNGFAGTQTSGWVTDILACDTGVEHTITNLLGNDGNFGVDSNADGLADGWTGVALAYKSISTNIQTFTTSAQYGALIKSSEIKAQKNGDKVYFCAYVLSTSSYVALYIYDGVSVSFANHSGSGAFVFLSSLTHIQNVSDSQITIQDNRASAWNQIQVKQAHLLNLTTIFGAGKEPTQAQMDRLVQWMIARFGYINTKALKLAWRSMQRFDGVDDYDAITNSASMDLGVIAGKEQVWSVLFRVTSGVSANGFLFCKNNTVATDAQFAMLYYTPTNTIELYLNGIARASVGVGAIVQNEFYLVTFYRDKLGVITPYVNKVSKPTSTYANALATQPNIRVGCRGNNSIYFKGDIAFLPLHEADDLDIDKIHELHWKIARDYVYTGV